VNLRKPKKILSKKEKDEIKNQEARETIMQKENNEEKKDNEEEGEGLINPHAEIFQDQCVMVKIEGRVKVGRIPRFLYLTSFLNVIDSVKGVKWPN